MVNFLSSISVCNSVDQPSIMANSVNSNDFLMNSKSSSSRKQKLQFNLVRICIVFIIWQYVLDKKVFPHFYILGWYSTRSDAQESAMQIHRALMDINESPLYVLLNPAINPLQKDLLVTIYESG
uniref:Uncharacterized protein n=1 Tax=Gossypium raimondii TaxID=29730 RepID=A0A0D2U958_GOSRA|nr:hypothetical protein B456_010G109300 [Gossypium raimondii]